MPELELLKVGGFSRDVIKKAWKNSPREGCGHASKETGLRSVVVAPTRSSAPHLPRGALGAVHLPCVLSVAIHISGSLEATYRDLES